MAAQPPEHLSQSSAEFYRHVVAEFMLEQHHLRLLALACEALDRCEEARRIIAEEGAVIRDRFGQQKAHPAIAIERDSRVAFARLLRELSLDVDMPADTSARPPARPGNASLRISG